MTIFKKHFPTSGLIAIIFTIIGFSSVLAETTKWVDLGGGKARLISVFDPISGEIEGIIDVELNPGWTTYWRNPGEAGIPPNFDFSASQGVSVSAPSFPVPISKSVAGIVTVGYYNHVAFPFKAAPLISPLSGKLKLDILLGVCEAVCIPAVASFEQDLSKLNQSDLISNSLIKEAKRKVPVRTSLDDKGPKIIKVFRKDPTSVIIRARVAASVKKPQLYAEGKRAWFFNPAKITDRTNDIVEFELSLQDLPTDADLAGTPLLLTLAADDIGSERQVYIDKK